MRWRDYLGPEATAEDAREALELAEQLPMGSRYVAELLGGPEFRGWDLDRQIAADTRNALWAITLGLGGKKLSKSQMISRPEVKTKQAATVAEFDVAAFMTKLAS